MRGRRAGATRALSAFAVVAAVATSSPSRALADGEAPPRARALALFERSDAAFKAGRFADAADLLQQAYALQAEPILLYDLGRAEEAAGDLERAIDAYERYLRAAPDAKNREGIARRVATLRAQLAERAELERRYREERRALEAEQARARLRSFEDSRRAATLPPKIALGAGAVTLGVGVGLGLLAAARESSARAGDTTQVAAARELDDARRFAVAANVGLAAGAALVVGGAAWLFVATRGRTAAPPPLAPL
ncbi:MAG TPA: tetratricopeptide repeat protein, partial [Minicystis sp.]|nr:tetratricopeptide repeat protein [Minicystis sp.]